MPFDENKFRVSVETGGIDTIKELGLPMHLRTFGTLLTINFLYMTSEPTYKTKTFLIKDIFRHMHIQAPAGPKEARVAVTRYLARNQTMPGEIAAYYVNSLESEEAWTVIGRCIALYHEVLSSVRKPFKSKWYKKETRVDDGEVKYTWVNVARGVDPKTPHAYCELASVRKAVGLSTNRTRISVCYMEMVKWKSCISEEQSESRIMDRISDRGPLFEELMRAAWHPKRHLRNCVGEGEFDMC
jgi:hypothetical protein